MVVSGRLHSSRSDHIVDDALRLGRLVDHVHRRGDLAAIVQKPGDLQFIAIGRRHAETGERRAASTVQTIQFPLREVR